VLYRLPKKVHQEKKVAKEAEHGLYISQKGWTMKNLHLLVILSLFVVSVAGCGKGEPVERSVAEKPKQKDRVKADALSKLGFRGIKWGTKFAHVKNKMTFVGTEMGMKGYIRKGEKLSIGDCELKSITYLFYKDRLCGVMVYVKRENFDDLKNVVFFKFGEGKQENQFMEEWTWKNGNIATLLSKEMIGDSIFSTNYFPIWERCFKDRDTRAKKAAARDF